MKKITLYTIAAIAALFLAGCSNEAPAGDTGKANKPATGTETTASESSASLVAYDLGTKKKGDKGICVVCNKNEGTTAEEEVVETVAYEGKTYIFCNESEKADFISDPRKYVAAK